MYIVQPKVLKLMTVVTVEGKTNKIMFEISGLGVDMLDYYFDQ